MMQQQPSNLHCHSQDCHNNHIVLSQHLLFERSSSPKSTNASLNRSSSLGDAANRYSETRLKVLEHIILQGSKSAQQQGLHQGDVLSISSNNLQHLPTQSQQQHHSRNTSSSYWNSAMVEFDNGPCHSNTPSSPTPYNNSINNYSNNDEFYEGSNLQKLSIVVDHEVIPLTEDGLSTLKVPVIKSISQSLGLKQTGKKSLLIERILSYAQTDQGYEFISSGLHINYEEPIRGRRRGMGQSTGVVHSQQESQQTVNTSTRSGLTTTTTSMSFTRVPSVSLSFPFDPKRSASIPSISNCLCRGTPRSHIGSLVQCIKCCIQLHTSCMKWDITTAEINKVDFVCPRCRLISLDPFYPVVDILWTTYLHPGLPEVNLVETPEGESLVIIKVESLIHTELLHKWRKEGKEVVVRCVTLGTPLNCHMQLQHDWPRTVDIKVKENVESICPPRPDHKRRDTPSIITHFLKPERNHIELVSSGLLDETGDTEPFMVGVFLCDCLDAKQLVAQIEDRCKSDSLVVGVERVQRLMKANRSIEDDDLECVEQNQRFRLSCPITLMRIMIPARGDDCRHLQCFDLESFIQVTKGSKAFNNRWKCPECPLILRNDAIVIDPFVSEILKIAPDNVEVVEVSTDGSYSFVNPSNEIPGEASSDEGEDLPQTNRIATQLSSSGTDDGNPWHPINVEDIDSDEDVITTQPQNQSQDIQLDRDLFGCASSKQAHHQNQYNSRKVQCIELGPSSSSSVSGIDSRHKRRRLNSHDREKGGENIAMENNLLSRNISTIDVRQYELIDLSPSSSSSTAATEPEDLVMDGNERPRKRRRGSSSSVRWRCGGTRSDRKRDDHDEDHDNKGCNNSSNSSQHSYSHAQGANATSSTMTSYKTGNRNEGRSREIDPVSTELDHSSQLRSFRQGPSMDVIPDLCERRQPPPLKSRKNSGAHTSITTSCHVSSLSTSQVATSPSNTLSDKECITNEIDSELCTPPSTIPDENLSTSSLTLNSSLELDPPSHDATSQLTNDNEYDQNEHVSSVIDIDVTSNLKQLLDLVLQSSFDFLSLSSTSSQYPSFNSDDSQHNIHTPDSSIDKSSSAIPLLSVEPSSDSLPPKLIKTPKYAYRTDPIDKSALLTSNTSKRLPAGRFIPIEPPPSVPRIIAPIVDLPSPDPPAIPSCRPSRKANEFELLPSPPRASESASRSVHHTGGFLTPPRLSQSHQPRLITLPPLDLPSHTLRLQQHTVTAPQRRERAPPRFTPLPLPTSSTPPASFSTFDPDPSNLSTDSCNPTSALERESMKAAESVLSLLSSARESLGEELTRLLLENNSNQCTPDGPKDSSESITTPATSVSLDVPIPHIASSPPKSILEELNISESDTSFVDNDVDSSRKWQSIDVPSQIHSCETAAGAPPSVCDDFLIDLFKKTSGSTRPLAAG